MKWKLVTGPLEDLESEGLAVGVFEDLDFSHLHDAASLPLAAKRVRFKGKPGESFYAFEFFGSPKKHLLVVGLGKKGECNPATFRSAAALAARKFRERYLKSAAIAFPLDGSGQAAGRCLRTLVEGVHFGNARFDRYLTDREAKFEGLARVLVVVPKKSGMLEESARLGALTAGAVLYARGS